MYIGWERLRRIGFVLTSARRGRRHSTEVYTTGTGAVLVPDDKAKPIVSHLSVPSVWQHLE